MVSLHVVSIDDNGKDDKGRSEENVTTVVVPDCVIVLSLHVVSQENRELGAIDGEPIKVTLLVILGRAGLCVAVIDPDPIVGPAGSCEEIPVDVEELDGGNMPDVDRAECVLLDDSPEKADDGLVVLGPPVDGVTTGLVKEGINVPELRLGPVIELFPIPRDEILLWPLNVSAPVFADVSICPDEAVPPVVELAVTLLVGFVLAADEELPGITEDSGNGFVPDL
ncbi:hypothetical protein RRF57_002639 [Xylaria bambusicola]|uniref:Uncharacterized protein n=1 Tax=Xylaria bambusicola TaxID=326684 RepID=A0AAN7UJA5_9PEZI